MDDDRVSRATSEGSASTSQPRRRFLRALASAPLLPALGDATPAPAPAPSPAPNTVEASARALAQVVEARYGSQLGRDDLDAVAKGIGEALEAAARLRAVRLDNADGPVTEFHARPPRPGGAQPAKADPR